MKVYTIQIIDFLDYIDEKGFIISSRINPEISVFTNNLHAWGIDF